MECVDVAMSELSGCSHVRLSVRLYVQKMI